MTRDVALLLEMGFRARHAPPGAAIPTGFDRVVGEAVVGGVEARTTLFLTSGVGVDATGGAWGSSAAAIHRWLRYAL